jgi:ABC-2 type transport system permease protein
MQTTLAVAVKELRQIARDRRTLMILLFVPALFLLLYGYALNFDIRNIHLAVADRDRSPASRTVVSAFINSGYFDLAADATSDAEIERLIDRNEARAAVVIPAGFGANVRNGRRTDVQVIVDGENSNTATTVIGYAQAIIGEVSMTLEREVALRARNVASLESVDLLPTAEGPPASGSPVILQSQVWYNPQLRSTLFLVPGLIAYISMITAVISTALSIVREKERGTMEQVRMAPVGPAAFIAGKTLPYLVLSFTSALLIILVAMALFDLPMRGSWLLLCAAIGLFLIGAQAQGLLISSVAPTQQVAFQLALLSSFLPTFILSGFIFPISSMPGVVQAITRVIPARYFLVALRAIVLKGAPLYAFWQDMLALAIFAGIALTLASLRLGREWRAGT